MTKTPPRRKSTKIFAHLEWKFLMLDKAFTCINIVLNSLAWTTWRRHLSSDGWNFVATECTHVLFKNLWKLYASAVTSRTTNLSRTLEDFFVTGFSRELSCIKQIDVPQTNIGRFPQIVNSLTGKGRFVAFKGSLSSILFASREMWFLFACYLAGFRKKYRSIYKLMLLFNQINGVNGYISGCDLQFTNYVGNPFQN